MKFLRAAALGRGTEGSLPMLVGADAAISKELRGMDYCGNPRALRFGEWDVEKSRTGLAAGGEAAAVRDRHAEVFVGIDRGIVDADFIMKMRAGGASAFSDETNYVTAMY